MALEPVSAVEYAHRSAPLILRLELLAANTRGALHMARSYTEEADRVRGELADLVKARTAAWGTEEGAA